MPLYLTLKEPKLDESWNFIGVYCNPARRRLLPVFKVTADARFDEESSNE